MVSEMFTITNNSNITNWSPESGYPANLRNVTRPQYPRRIFNSKPLGALIVYPRLLKCDMSYECRGPFHGFTVAISSPVEMIGLSRRIIRVSPQEQVDISIAPVSIYSSKKIEQYKPVQRQCFNNGERQLRFFKFYGKHNCEMECLTNFTKKECGCVKYSMPSMNSIDGK